MILKKGTYLHVCKNIIFANLANMEYTMQLNDQSRNTLDIAHPGIEHRGSVLRCQWSMTTVTETYHCMKYSYNTY